MYYRQVLRTFCERVRKKIQNSGKTAAGFSTRTTSQFRSRCRLSCFWKKATVLSHHTQLIQLIWHLVNSIYSRNSGSLKNEPVFGQQKIEKIKHKSMAFMNSLPEKDCQQLKVLREKCMDRGGDYIKKDNIARV